MQDQGSDPSGFVWAAILGLLLLGALIMRTGPAYEPCTDTGPNYSYDQCMDDREELLRESRKDGG